MRIFMTGASGYIGSVVAEKAVEQGHTVVGLARSQASQEKLKKLGVTPLAGDLESLDLLTRAAAESDAVLHLGFVHEFHRPYSELLAIDKAAIRAMGKGIAGTGKPLIMTSGTGVTEPDVNGGETNEDSPLTNSPLRERTEAEETALALQSEGIRPIVMRLAPYVYGRGGSVFVPALLKAAAEHGFAFYVGDGSALTSSAEVDATAQLYLLAAEKADAGSIFNGTTETNIPLRQLGEAIGKAVGVPTKSVSLDEASAMVGPFIAKFMEIGNRGSSEKARRVLGWKPQPKLGLLDDLTNGNGSYREFVAGLHVRN
jgi:nucleoside-diphosphate-sugar epimerase